MLDDNILIRTFLGAIFAILMAISLTITFYSKSAVDIISDRENMRTWLTDEAVQYELVDYVLQKAFSPLTLELSEKILGEEKYNELLHSQLVENSAETITNNTIDTLYDWMEGEIDSPELVLHEKNKEDLIVSPLSAFLDENLGFLNEFVDVGDLINSNESMTLIEIAPEKLVGMQKAYQSIQKIPQIFLFVTFIFGALTLIALRSWRHRFLFIGLALAGSGFLLLWGDNFITYEGLASSRALETLGYSLPDVESLPNFLQLTLSMASSQIIDQSRTYGIYLLISGLILGIVSQLAVRDVEEKEYGIEETDGDDEYSDYELEDEELLEE